MSESKEKTTSHWIRIPLSRDKKIREIARNECRTIASVISQAVKEFLERREKNK